MWTGQSAYLPALETGVGYSVNLQNARCNNKDE